MAAKQASNTATNPGMDAPQRVIFFRQRAETYATSKPILSAGTTDCFWLGETLKSGGIAAACTPRGSWPGRRFRSPNSSDQYVASPSESDRFREAQPILRAAHYPNLGRRRC